MDLSELVYTNTKSINSHIVCTTEKHIIDQNRHIEHFATLVKNSLVRRLDGL